MARYRARREDNTMSIITRIIVAIMLAIGAFSMGNNSTVSYTHLTLPTNREV